ncbi:MAG TPA: hypothetical protein VFY36_03940 [Solirubrobacteraceae bacterium]|nr:hypothetical protein [Solirubrobacteraceae bacterium]
MAISPNTQQTHAASSAHEPKGLSEKLSAHFVVFLAVAAFLLGLGGAIGAHYIPTSYAVWADALQATSEALMVTGVTTLIVSFALFDDFRLERILKSLLLPRIADILRPERMRAVADSAIHAHLPDAVNQICSRIAQAESVSQQIAGAYVLHRSEIYPRSITMLQELRDGDVRILMSAEEDLSDTSPSGESDSESESNAGAEWVDQLDKWLRHDFDGNHLVRVIAARPKSAGDVARVRDRLVLPFEGANANQWVYADSEFSVSILLLGDRHAIFGFLPRRNDMPPNTPRVLSRTTRLEYGVVVTNRMLVKNLITWFEDRYTKDGNSAIATKVMTKGEVDEDALNAFAQEHGIQETACEPEGGES